MGIKSVVEGQEKGLSKEPPCLLTFRGSEGEQVYLYSARGYAPVRLVGDRSVGTLWEGAYIEDDNVVPFTGSITLSNDDL